MINYYNTINNKCLKEMDTGNVSSSSSKRLLLDMCTQQHQEQMTRLFCKNVSHRQPIHYTSTCYRHLFSKTTSIYTNKLCIIQRCIHYLQQKCILYNTISQYRLMSSFFHDYSEIRSFATLSNKNSIFRLLLLILILSMYIGCIVENNNNYYYNNCIHLVISCNDNNTIINPEKFITNLQRNKTEFQIFQQKVLLNNQKRNIVRDIQNQQLKQLYTLQCDCIQKSKVTTTTTTTISRWMFSRFMILLSTTGGSHQQTFLVNAFIPAIPIRIPSSYQLLQQKRNMLPITASTTSKQSATICRKSVYIYQQGFMSLHGWKRHDIEESATRRRMKVVRKDSRIILKNKPKKVIEEDNDNESTSNNILNVFSNVVPRKNDADDNKQESNNSKSKRKRKTKDGTIIDNDNDNDDDADNNGFFGLFKSSSSNNDKDSKDSQIENERVRLKKRYVVRGIFENAFTAIGFGNSSSTSQSTKTLSSSSSPSSSSTTSNLFKKYLPFLDSSSNNNTNTADKEKKSKRDGNDNDSNILSSIQKYSSSVIEIIPKITFPNITITNPFASNVSDDERKAGKNRRKEEEWVFVMSKTRISPGEMVPVTIVGGIDLLVIASTDGRRLYCVANSCPHLGTPFETGTLTRLPKEESTSTSFTKRTLTSKGTDTTNKNSNSNNNINFNANNNNLDSSSSNTISDDDDNNVSILSNTLSILQQSTSPFTETSLSDLLQQDGCEDCIVCPLHRTAFALQSGEVRGEWCPYPPIIGKVVGAVKQPTNAAVFDIRTRGKNIEIRLNTPII